MTAMRSVPAAGRASAAVAVASSARVRPPALAAGMAFTVKAARCPRAVGARRDTRARGKEGPRRRGHEQARRRAMAEADR